MNFDRMKNYLKKSGLSWGNMAARFFLVFLSVASVYPLLFTLITSLRTEQDFYQDILGLPQAITPDNYTNAIAYGNILSYFINSLIITVTALIFILILGVLSAYGLSRLKVPKVELILTVLFICQMLPQESMLIPLYVISGKLGILKIPYVSMIIPYVGWSLAGAIIMLKVFFDTLPGDLIEAARIDGCNEFQTMFRIVAALMKPSICTVMMFAFCGCWGELLWAQQSTLMTEKGIPLSVGLLRFQGNYTTDWGQLAAAMMFVLIPLLVIFAFTQKYLIAGFMGGAVKG